MALEVYTTDCEEQTLAFAADFAAGLVAGDVVAMRGGLGAGKTAFVRGMAAGLGIEQSLVSSPTFSLVNEYRGENITLYHFDMYRVTGEDALCSTGFYDFLDSDGILAVEWSENISGALPPRSIILTLERGDEENHRKITIERP